jgi:hypothetical protein
MSKERVWQELQALVKHREEVRNHYENVLYPQIIAKTEQYWSYIPDFYSPEYLRLFVADATRSTIILKRLQDWVSSFGPQFAYHLYNKESLMPIPTFNMRENEPTSDILVESLISLSSVIDKAHPQEVTRPLGQDGAVMFGGVENIADAPSSYCMLVRPSNRSACLYASAELKVPEIPWSPVLEVLEEISKTHFYNGSREM